jgi:ABC-type nitrate/sulfonate/bicarbonate transport system ATPase subunit
VRSTIIRSILTIYQALARAVYARPDIVLLDDVLSALDLKTEALMIQRLFASTGIFSKHGTTVILATHAGGSSDIEVVDDDC